ncbi:MAG: metal-sensing transcriptional repressor [Candidatus Dojkabacteria bacterium]|nr:metal-sensing transcriptional repressor [Candidatus Dojkabacteria bacterium]
MPKTGRSTLEDRLHRIEGQLRAIETMLSGGEDLQKVMIQLEAVISGLQGVKVELVKKNVEKKLQEHMREALDLLR